MDKPNIYNEFQKSINEVIENVNQQIDELEVNMLLSDIIDIYNGFYKNYTEYYEAQVEYNSKCRKHNTPNYDKNNYSYTFTYMPEKRIILKRNFDFIRLLALEKKNKVD